MEKVLSVLLVEDDKEECNEFIKILDSAGDIRLVGVTNNKNTALESVKDHLPDVVILDIELHKGNGNGIGFLESLNNMKIKPSPYILVTTHNISLITHEVVRQLGADFIMVKSQEDYSAQSVISFLRSLRKTIQEIQKKINGKNQTAIKAPAEIKKRRLVRVTAEIDKIGVSPKALGRSYLIDAIIHRIEGKHDQFASIATKYGKTVASVERAMQNAINKAWITTNPEDLLMLYTSRIHSEKGVPTVMEFICHYANKIKANY